MKILFSMRHPGALRNFGSTVEELARRGHQIHLTFLMRDKLADPRLLENLTAAYTTIVHSATNQTVDVVLAFLLMVGGVAGAQYGARAGQKLRGEQLRALLALLVLAVALRLAFDLFVQPRDLYSLTGLEGASL